MTRGAVRVALRFAWYAVLAGIAAGLSARFAPEHRTTATDAYLLFLGGLALLFLVRATSGAESSRGPSTFERALAGRRRRTRQGLEQLRRLEIEVVLAMETAADLHYRLRPLLREIAQYRLASRRGVDLEADPGAARALLGADLWELVRPDRQPPARRHGPGADLTRLRAAVDALERI